MSRRAARPRTLGDLPAVSRRCLHPAPCLQFHPLPPQGAKELSSAGRAFSSATNGDTDGTIERGADGLILPHGGASLVDLMASGAAADEARARCNYQLELTERQVGTGRWAD